MCSVVDKTAATATPPSAKLDGFYARKCLVEGAGPLKTLVVMIYCHLSVTLLCLNVMFDLLVFGVPVFLLHKFGVLPNKVYLAFTTSIINWTTPTVFAMPMVFSGSKLYCNDIDLLKKCKSTDSLLLSNHGSVSASSLTCFVNLQRWWGVDTMRNTAYRLDGCNVCWVLDIRWRQALRESSSWICMRIHNSIHAADRMVPKIRS